MLEHLELQDVGFTGVLDSALKWVIKNKAKCIDELQEVDVVKTRLDKIKDALVTEKNEEAAAVAVGAATSDDPLTRPLMRPSAVPTPPSTRSMASSTGRHMLPRRSRRTSDSPQSRGPRQVWRS
jgi:hypothetical protein